MNRPQDCSGPRSMTRIGLHPGWRANVLNYGLRGQPTCDRSGNDLSMFFASDTTGCPSTTRGHVASAQGLGRKAGPFKQLGPRFQVVDFLTPVGAPPGRLVPRFRASPWMVRKLVEQLLAKSGRFLLKLRSEVSDDLTTLGPSSPGVRFDSEGT